MLSISSDNSEFKPPRQKHQEKSQAPAGGEITCASMRAEELRACLVREILRASAIGMQAQAALRGMTRFTELGFR
jgi:hypothetical protein